MISASEIEQALLSRLSHEHHEGARRLAKLLADAAKGSPVFDDADQTAGAEYEELLRILAGQTIQFGTTQIAFKRGAGRNTVTIRQAAGGTQNQPAEFVMAISGNRNIVVGRDVINSVIANVDLVFPQYLKSEPVDPDALEAARSLLDGLLLEPVPEPGTLPERSRMPFRRNNLFVGREGNLRWLARRLKGETAARMPLVSISGIPGVGKTQLATEFVHRYGRFFAGGIFWLNFSNPDAVAAEVIACGGPEGLDLPNFSFLSPEHQLQKVLSAWQSPLPRLLVFDNCEGDELLDRWLPTTGGCRVLVTSWQTEWDPSLEVQVLPLDMFSRAESIELIRKFRKDLPAIDPDLNAIAAELGDLPQALYLAGSYLRLYKDETTPTEYLSQLRGPPLLRHPSLTSGGLSPTRHIQNVARTFDLSYVRLNPADPEHALALQILPRASHFAPGTLIPRHLLRESVNLNDAGTRLRFTKPLKRLLKLGLLEVNGYEGSLRMHRLLGLFVRDRVDVPAEAAARKAVEVVILSTIDYPEGFGYQDTLLPLQPHIRTVVDEAFEHYFGAGDYDSAIGTQLSVDRLLEKWGASRHLLAQHERVRDKLTDPLLKSMSMLHTGSALLNLGETRGAVPHAVLALEFGRQSGERIDAVASALDLLGRCHLVLGEAEEAVGHFIQALKTAALVRPRNLKMEGKIHLNLGHSYYELGHTRRAIRQTERALDIARRLADRDVARELSLLCELSRAQCYFVQGQTGKAIEVCCEALAEARSFGEARVEATCLGNLGEYFTALARFEPARESVEQALSKCAEFGLKREESYVLHTLSELLIDEENLDLAASAARGAAEAGLAVGKPQLISDSRNALARAYIFLDDFPAARAAAASALEHGTALNRHHASALAGLAALRQGDSEGAAENFRLALREAEALIKSDPLNYRAFDTCGLAFRGLTLLEGSSHQPEGLAAHSRAREINSDLGVVRRVSRLLKLIDAGSA